MTIIVDAYGGDNAPLSVIKGSEEAVREYGVKIILTGDKEDILRVAEENNINLNNIEIEEADGVIEVEDDPKEIVRSKSNSSMGVAFKLLLEGRGDAFVSGGSTGAIVVGASLIIKRIKGIRRAALAPIIPSSKGCYMLIDGGANLDCRAEMLMQFGIMGSVYMNKIMGIDKPKVGLVNVGEEVTKGTELYLDSYRILSESDINFYGNLEARDIPAGVCDVVVCDGFTGNIILKLTEGLGKELGGKIKDIYKVGILSKLSGLLISKKLMMFKKKMDYTEYGGAALMGVSKPVIKAHGSSNANAIKNAIRQAKAFVDLGVIEEIKKHMECQKK